MLNAIFVGIRFVILVLSGHRHVALENAALRQQLAVSSETLNVRDCTVGIDCFGLG